MARKVTAYAYMTLDGRGEFPTYPGSDRVPKDTPDQMRVMWETRYDDVTTVVFGRRSFLGHRRFWTEKARKPSDPKYVWELARFFDRVDKVCLSRRLKSLGWENSRLMRGDLASIISKLRREKGGNIIVDGGPRLVREMIQRGLADDYCFFVMPVVYGRGPSYWGPRQTGQSTLKFVSASGTEDGELLLHYKSAP